MSYSNSPILVTGASGHLGRSVVSELVRLGATNVVAASRTPEKLGDLKDLGVEVRAADFDKPETLISAFDGIERVAIISTDSLEVPGQRLAQHRAAISAAAQIGVKHVVYTSAPGTHPTPEDSLINDHFWTEVALFESSFTWTVLRNQLYTELILRSAGHAIESGKLYSATDGRGRAYVTREDCARSVAGALLTGETSEVLDITGPAAITQDELAAILTELSGKPVVHVNVPPQGLADGLTSAGLPPVMVKVVVDFDVDASQGYHALVTPVVKRLTGTSSQTVKDFLKANLTLQ